MALSNFCAEQRRKEAQARRALLAWSLLGSAVLHSSLLAFEWLPKLDTSAQEDPIEFVVIEPPEAEQPEPEEPLEEVPEEPEPVSESAPEPAPGPESAEPSPSITQDLPEPPPVNPPAPEPAIAAPPKPEPEPVAENPLPPEPEPPTEPVKPIEPVTPPEPAPTAEKSPEPEPVAPKSEIAALGPDNDTSLESEVELERQQWLREEELREQQRIREEQARAAALREQQRIREEQARRAQEELHEQQRIREEQERAATPDPPLNPEPGSDSPLTQPSERPGGDSSNTPQGTPDRQSVARAAPPDEQPATTDGGGIGSGPLACRRRCDGPSYPRSARADDIEGVVRVQFDVTEDGAVTNARISRSSGNSALDKAALKTVENRRYEPIAGGKQGQEEDFRFVLEDS